MQVHEWNVVSPLLSQWEGEPQGTLIGQRVEEVGKSEDRSVMGQIEPRVGAGCNLGMEIPNPKGCRLPTGVSSRESLRNRLRRQSR